MFLAACPKHAPRHRDCYLFCSILVVSAYALMLMSRLPHSCRTVRGLFDGMFVGLRQVLDSAEYEQPYEALSMVREDNWG